MSELKIDGRVSLLRPVRALYCNVLQARKFKENGQERVGSVAKFDVTCVLTKEDVGDLGKVVRSVLSARWPGRDIKELQMPFKSVERQIAWIKRKKGEAADVSVYNSYTGNGHYILKASSQYQPVLLRFRNGAPAEYGPADAAEVKQKFYNGCWIVPRLNIVPFVAKKETDNDGLTAYLDAVLWIKDGERIGGNRLDPKEAFSGYMGTISQDDPLAGETLDDEIPF